MNVRHLVQRRNYYAFVAIKYVLDCINRFVALFERSRKGELPAITDPLLLESAVSLCAKIKKFEITCEDVIRAYIKRIEQVQPVINAVIDTRFNEAIEEAKQFDNVLRNGSSQEKNALLDKPLLGLPFTCKDSISVKGCNFTAGLMSRKGIKAEEDAPVVTLMREAGAIPLAVTNVPEFLLFWNSENPLYGRTKNPYDLSRIPGGSSGGEAALIASAGSVLGIGSDIGGSLRIPPHCCGEYATMGPIARYARDLPSILKVITNNSPKLKLNEEVDLKRIKIYYTDENIGNPLVTPVSDEIKQTMKKAIDYLSTRYGIVAERIRLRELIYSMGIFSAAIKLKDPRTLAESVTNGNGTINPVHELLKYMFGRSNHTLGIILASLMENMSFSKPESDFGKYCLQMSESLKEKFRQILDDGVFFYPTLPEVAIKHRTIYLKSFDAHYTTVFNILELPSTHCTFGLSKDGLPLGFQMITLPFNDRLTLALAIEFEKTFGGWTPPCSIHLPQ
ncbi:glutamyl-tRNA amidotransferase subunit A-like protein [Dinothrombium tinctorium]|uniref:Glutamyl-tRNA amidotransferase subunit A-like protein n=1 Tax=Dinothrombium tinctorium TaxID=1965070 RepID=A0A3S3P4B3_9ACAR|nr:glutamyl-tRNA amidotransferase subunit A-like protein [Dinothrombium tinctorium]